MALVTARILPFCKSRPALKPAIPDAHPRLLAAALNLIDPRKEHLMRIVRRIKAAPAITRGGEVAIRLRAETNAEPVDLVIAPRQAEALIAELTAIIGRQKAEARFADAAKRGVQLSRHTVAELLGRITP